MEASLPADLSRALPQPLIRQHQERMGGAELRKSLSLPDTVDANPFLRPAVDQKPEDADANDPAFKLSTAQRAAETVQQAIRRWPEAARASHQVQDRVGLQDLLVD